MKFNVEKQANDYKLTLIGTIDEDADFSQIQIPPGSVVQVHLKDVTSINSCGIREWITWFSTVKFTKVVFYECPKVVVDQMNIVQGFLPPASQIISFYVPYFHEDSGSEKSILFTVGKEFDELGKLHAPPVKDDAGNEMEMDVIEAKYFKFIKKT